MVHRRVKVTEWLIWKFIFVTDGETDLSKLRHLMCDVICSFLVFRKICLIILSGVKALNKILSLSTIPSCTSTEIQLWIRRLFCGFLSPISVFISSTKTKPNRGARGKLEWPLLCSSIKGKSLCFHLCATPPQELAFAAPRDINLFSCWETPCFYSPDEGSEKKQQQQKPVIKNTVRRQSLICLEAMSRLSGLMSVNYELRQTSESVGKGNTVLLNSVFVRHAC